jgi:hypothetical protein
VPDPEVQAKPAPAAKPAPSRPAPRSDDDFGDADPLSEREVIAAILKDRPDVCPQAVGEDRKGVMAGKDSQLWWNGTAVTQVVYRRAAGNRAIHLLPGDCVVGAEFRRYSKANGGVLQQERPTAVKARSKRDSAYFLARRRMKGELAERAGKVEVSHPRALDSGPRT